jgi:hypothetical protein
MIDEPVPFFQMKIPRVLNGLGPFAELGEVEVFPRHLTLHHIFLISFTTSPPNFQLPDMLLTIKRA